MSITMHEGIKWWTVRRKSGLVLEIIQGKTTVSEASWQFDRAHSGIEEWIERGKAGMENALRTEPADVHEKYEREIKSLHESYGEAIKAMIEAEPSFADRTVANQLGFNKNTVQRIFQIKGWPVRKRRVGLRPGSRRSLLTSRFRMTAGRPTSAGSGSVTMAGCPSRS